MTDSLNVLAVFGLGGTELIVILVILLVMFGGTKLPGLAKGLGQSIKEFKKAAKEGEEEAAKPTESKKTEETKSVHSSN